MKIVTDLGFFILFFPLIMGVVWALFGLLYWIAYERKPQDDPPEVKWPPLAILIPCHNEAASIEKTCDALTFIQYPHYEVYFIDDASTDDTATLLKQRVSKNAHYTLVALQENQGKANALNHVLPMVAATEITVVMDADTIMKPETLTELIRPMVSAPHYDVVTCNPFVYNKETLLGKIQALEFASIVGLIKRATLLFDCMFTVSGCLTAFRTQALLDVNGFSPRTATEDIDVTWRLQERHYRVGFAPKALAYIEAPTRVKELWNQRKRWALGGWHLLRQHAPVLQAWRSNHLKLLYLHFLISYVWAVLLLLFLVGGALLFLVMSRMHQPSPIPLFSFGSVLTVVYVAQMLISVKISRHYDPSIKQTLLWLPWYPLFYFCIGALAICATLPKGLFQRVDHAGKWKSPRRAKAL